jgi:hypothetical protein
MPVSHFIWQVLRTALRAGKKYRTGRALRIVPNKFSKDGSFLTNLVDRGLLRVVKPADDPFEATYALTELGEYAAEHGEYEWQPPRKSPPPELVSEPARLTFSHVKKNRPG